MTSRRARLAWSAVAAFAVYLVLWIGYAAQWNWLSTADGSILEFFYRHGTDSPGWVTAWNVFCTVLGSTAFRVVTLVPIVVAFARRNVRVAMFLLVSVELSGLVTQIAKEAAQRSRPGTALVAAESWSFPSGHALGVTVGVLALLSVGLPLVGGRVRTWLVVAGAALIIAMGVGRVVLNVHHPSDVVAGWALGYAWFVLCLLAVSPNRPITTPDERPEAPGTAR